jgi:hypothetical protein
LTLPEDIKDLEKRKFVEAAGEVAVRTTATFTPSGTQDCNIKEVGGNAVTTTVPVSGLVSVSNMIPAVETGLATSAKQLSDGHNVNVSNMIPSVETGLAKDSSLSNLSNLDVALSTRLKAADTLTKVSTVDTITNVVHIDDNSSSISVDANNLDIRDLTSVSDSVSAVLTDGLNNVTVTNNKLDVNATLTAQTIGTNDLWQFNTFNGKGFVSITPDIIFSTTDEIDFILIKNPSGSGRLIRFYDFLFNTSKGTSSVRGDFRFYRNPTITTNGTSITINKIRLSQSTSSICYIYYIPTISARGTLIGKVDNQTFSEGSRRIFNLGRYLEQNENLLITFEPATSGITASLTVQWVEE